MSYDVQLLGFNHVSVYKEEDGSHVIVDLASIEYLKAAVDFVESQKNNLIEFLAAEGIRISAQTGDLIYQYFQDKK